jgi:preprotein translocase subunit SecB
MDNKLICEASKKLRLQSINLFECNLKRFNDLPEEGELGQQTKLSVKSEKIAVVSDHQSFDVLRILVDLGVRVVLVSVESENEPPPLFQIEAVYQLDYELTGSIEQSALDEFAKYNAVHNVWPFWRQYVFSIANQAGLPCPEIPLNTSLQNLENLSETHV